MVARRAPLLLLIGLIALVGCRDTLVDEPIQPDTPPTAPTQTARPIYIKGPGVLGVGIAGDFYAERLLEAVRYDWSQDSVDRGQVSGSPNDASQRRFELTGVRSGTVRVTVLALDASNRVIGRGTRTISVGY